jgi:hypothetical protein
MPLRLSHRYILEGSRNPVLQEICFLVDRYNREFRDAPSWAAKTSLDAQAAALAGLAYRAGAYMTSKPPQRGKFKNKARWDAMRDLMADLMKEAEGVGVKLVRGPADFRKIAVGVKADGTKDDGNVSIWLEVLDAKHRHAYNLAESWQKWLSTTGKQSFWEYVGSGPMDEVAYYQGLLFSTQFRGECLVKDDDEPVDTREYRSLFSGFGWCIFVYSPDGTLYVHEHEKGEFHHTSFLGGGAVLAAGEIVVDQGRVVALTAKTGHYWTTPELMLSMARRLRGIPEAIIRPDVLDSANGRGVQFYRMRDYVVNGAKATPLDRSEIRRSLPTWVQGSELENQLRKAPAAPEELERVPAPQTKTLSVEEKKAQGYTNPLDG